MKHASSHTHGFLLDGRFLRIVFAAVLAGVFVPAWSAHAATVILNEYNAVRNDENLDGGSSDTHFGTVVGNGWDWFELVVVGDGTAGGTVPMTGWSVTIRTDGTAAGTLVLNSNPFWAGVQNGTILTFTESNTAGGGLNTDVNRVDSFATLGYGWSNFYIGDRGIGATDYFTVGSSTAIMGGDTHKDTQFTIKNSLAQVVFGPAGEGVAPTGGVGNDEVCKLEKDPSPAITENDDGYNDGTSSTFGSPNTWSGGANTQNFNAFNTSSTPSDLTWDITPGNSTTEDGTGTWADTAGNWYNLAAAADDTWDSSQPDSATFGSGAGGAHTVTLDGPITAGDLTFAPGPLYTLTGGALTVRGNVTANESAVINSDLTLTSTGAQVEVAVDKTLTVGGALLGSDDFEVRGEGTVVLSADNSAFNDTISLTNDATLEVNGDLATGSLVHVKSEAKLIVGAGATIGDVLVDSGSKVRIEGEGTIGGGLIMDDDDAKVRGNLTVVGKVEIIEGIISPGQSNSPGLLTFNDDLTLGKDVTYTWQLFNNTDAGPGVNFDLVTVGDQLKADEVDPQNNDFTQLLVDIEMRDLVDMSNPFWAGNHSWMIVDIGRADNFTEAMLIRGSVLDTDDTTLGFADRFSVSLDGGGNVLVNYEVPEPSGLALLVGGGLAVLRRRRKVRKVGTDTKIETRLAA